MDILALTSVTASTSNLVYCQISVACALGIISSKFVNFSYGNNVLLDFYSFADEDGVLDWSSNEWFDVSIKDCVDYDMKNKTSYQDYVNLEAAPSSILYRASFHDLNHLLSDDLFPSLNLSSISINLSPRDNICYEKSVERFRNVKLEKGFSNQVRYSDEAEFEKMNSGGIYPSEIEQGGFTVASDVPYHSMIGSRTSMIYNIIIIHVLILSLSGVFIFRWVRKNLKYWSVTTLHRKSAKINTTAVISKKSQGQELQSLQQHHQQQQHRHSILLQMNEGVCVSNQGHSLKMLPVLPIAPVFPVLKLFPVSDNDMKLSVEKVEKAYYNMIETAMIATASKNRAMDYMTWEIDNESESGYSASFSTDDFLTPNLISPNMTPKMTPNMMISSPHTPHTPQTPRTPLTPRTPNTPNTTSMRMKSSFHKLHSATSPQSHQSSPLHSHLGSHLGSPLPSHLTSPLPSHFARPFSSHFASPLAITKNQSTSLSTSQSAQSTPFHNCANQSYHQSENQSLHQSFSPENHSFQSSFSPDNQSKSDKCNFIEELDSANWIQDLRRGVAGRIRGPTVPISVDSVELAFLADWEKLSLAVPGVDNFYDTDVTTLDSLHSSFNPSRDDEVYGAIDPYGSLGGGEPGYGSFGICEDYVTSRGGEECGADVCGAGYGTSVGSGADGGGGVGGGSGVDGIGGTSGINWTGGEEGVGDKRGIAGGSAATQCGTSSKSVRSSTADFQPMHTFYAVDELHDLEKCEIKLQIDGFDRSGLSSECGGGVSRVSGVCGVFTREMMHVDTMLSPNTAQNSVQACLTPGEWQSVNDMPRVNRVPLTRRITPLKDRVRERTKSKDAINRYNNNNDNINNNMTNNDSSMNNNNNNDNNNNNSANNNVADLLESVTSSNISCHASDITSASHVSNVSTHRNGSNGSSKNSNGSNHNNGNNGNNGSNASNSCYGNNENNSNNNSNISNTSVKARYTFPETTQNGNINNSYNDASGNHTDEDEGDLNVLRRNIGNMEELPNCGCSDISNGDESNNGDNGDNGDLNGQYQSKYKSKYQNKYDNTMCGGESSDSLTSDGAQSENDNENDSAGTSDSDNDLGHFYSPPPPLSNRGNSYASSVSSPASLGYIVSYPSVSNRSEKSR